MLAGRVDGIAFGIFLDHFHIGDQGGTGKNAFKQVMAEHGIFRDFSMKCGFKGINIVNAFTRERPFAKQVLIDVRYGENVRIDAT